MLQLVEMLQNMVTEFPEFGSTQDQPSYTSALLSMETKTIVTTLPISLVATSSQLSQFNKSRNKNMETTISIKSLSMVKRLWMS